MSLFRFRKRPGSIKPPESLPTPDALVRYPIENRFPTTTWVHPAPDAAPPSEPSPKVDTSIDPRYFENPRNPDSVHFTVRHPDGSSTDYGLKPYVIEIGEGGIDSAKNIDVDIHNLKYIAEHYNEVNAREIKRVAVSAAARIEALIDIKKRYLELIYAVANKYPGETRYETALRYIRQAERGGSEDCGGQCEART